MPDIKAIDVHVHLNDELSIEAMGPRAAQMARYFGYAPKPVSIDELADQYRARQMMAVLMNTTDRTATGIAPVPNDHIAAAVRKHSDVFIGFGAIDPAEGKVAIDEVKRCAQELGLRGIGELNPGRQHFYPNDPQHYPLWEQIGREHLVVLFHTGMLGGGAGTPGGLGLKLKYTRPIPYLDDLAADLPDLRIIGAHPSWPWQEESLAICRHKSNFYIDLSGWAPKYFGSELVQYVNSIIQDRVLFGSDWPAITPDRWLHEFDQLSIKAEVRQKILLDNARHLLGLQ